jgi:hypothetical protein
LVQEQLNKRKAMYVKRNAEVLSCNHGCSGNEISITYSECACVCVALGIQHAMRMRHGLPRSTIFSPHYLINGAISGKTSLNTKYVF